MLCNIHVPKGKHHVKDKLFWNSFVLQSFQEVKNEAATQALEEEFSTAEAKKAANRNKNRYRDVSPCKLVGKSVWNIYRSLVVIGYSSSFM